MKYQVLVADPPWLFKDKLGRRGAECRYPCLSLDDLCNFPLPELEQDCVLFLWRLSSLLPEALTVCRAWGFRPYSELVWVKTTTKGKMHFGMGHLLRNSHESCLVALRGRRPAVLSRSVRSVLVAPYSGHSYKPEAFFGLVESLFAGPYCELFARRQRVGWDCFGEESIIETPPRSRER